VKLCHISRSGPGFLRHSDDDNRVFFVIISWRLFYKFYVVFYSTKSINQFYEILSTSHIANLWKFTLGKVHKTNTKECNWTLNTRIRANTVIMSWSSHMSNITTNSNTRVGTKISMILYISTIKAYIMIVSWYFQLKMSWYFWYFQNINLYYDYLLTFLIHKLPKSLSY